MEVLILYGGFMILSFDTIKDNQFIPTPNLTVGQNTPPADAVRGLHVVTFLCFQVCRVLRMPASGNRPRGQA
jgi:hypothetical protein